MKTLTAIFWSVFWFGVLLALFVFVVRVLRRVGSGNVLGRVGNAIQGATDTSR